jgi:hypothetical protein
MIVYSSVKLRSNFFLSLFFFIFCLEALFIVVLNMLRKNRLLCLNKLYIPSNVFSFFLFRYINLFFLSVRYTIKSSNFSLTDNRICISIQIWGKEQIFYIDQCIPLILVNKLLYLHVKHIYFKLILIHENLGFHYQLVLV